MIISVSKDNNLKSAFDEIGLGDAIKESGTVLIKINLARPPELKHPRTDPALLAESIRYAARYQACCAVAECADGFLSQNLASIGLQDVIREHRVQLLDLDREDFDCVSLDGQKHYLPKCMKRYGTRLGIPATSKRLGMVFSNNVKLFVGAVPRNMYQSGQGGYPRPRIHVDLHTSIVNIYRAVMDYAPFTFFLNGGKALFEQDQVDLDKIYIGNNALDLDQHILTQYGLESPEYIDRLAGTPEADMP